MIVVSTPKIKVSGLKPPRRYVSIQNGTGVVSASEGIKITFSTPQKPQAPAVIEVRESSSET
jgi:hypothetical protein